MPTLNNVECNFEPLCLCMGARNSRNGFGLELLQQYHLNVYTTFEPNDQNYPTMIVGTTIVGNYEILWKKRRIAYLLISNTAFGKLLEIGGINREEKSWKTTLITKFAKESSIPFLYFFIQRGYSEAELVKSCLKQIQNDLNLEGFLPT